MTEKEKQQIKQFMRLVLKQLHPQFVEYPIQDMKQAEDAFGVGFEDTAYANNESLICAYYMAQIIDTL